MPKVSCRYGHLQQRCRVSLFDAFVQRFIVTDSSHGRPGKPHGWQVNSAEITACVGWLAHLLKAGQTTLRPSKLIHTVTPGFTDICSPDKCSHDLILAREICQYGHRRYLTNYFYRTMHYSAKHGLAIAVLYC